MQREIDNILRKIYETIDKFYPNDVKIDYKKYLEKSECINLLNNQQNNLTFLIDIKHLRVIHMNGSVFNFTGYEIEEFGENILPKFMTLIVSQHLSFFSTFVSWSLNNLKNVSAENRKKQFLSVWGLKLLHKNQRTLKWYLNIIPIEFSEDGYPTLIVLSIQDITYLIKSDEYLIRMAFGEENKKIAVYYSNEDKTIENDIISEREREVLEYISQGFDTKSIASTLNITKNTVDNHRRNMLARTGTRDTTALIQLCRMAGVL